MGQKRLPLGIENFQKVKEYCYYVDKTGWIREISRYVSGSVLLFTRPRRFGKSLGLSMLEYFYSNQKNSRDLFCDTDIYQDADLVHREMNHYPLLHLDLKTVDGDTYNVLLKKLQEQMALALEHYPIDLSKCSPYDAKRIEDLKMRRLSESDLSDSLTMLTRAIHDSSGVEVMVLVDEYDAPIQSAYEHGYYKKAIEFFRNYFGAALKGNDHLAKAVLTGVTQIAQASIFSGLNNLIVNSVLSSGAKEYFGFRKDEVNRIFDYYGYEFDENTIRKWYGGYRVQDQEIYNPWSIFSCINNGGRLGTYWTNTGSMNLLEPIFSKGEGDALKDISRLMNGEHILSKLNSALNYLDIGREDTTLALLTFGGYLSAEKTSVPEYYNLTIPNQEIRENFQNEISQRYIHRIQADSLLDLKQALERGEKEKIQDALLHYLDVSFSYYDFSDEKNYQIFVLSLSAVLFEDAIVKSEVITGEGRCDILILPKEKGKTGIVIEIKSLKGKASETRMEKTAQAALSQIEKKNYVNFLREMECQKMYGYGMAFNRKKLKVAAMEIK